MTRYVVATVDEIPPGGRKTVTVARRTIGVFNVGGAFYALRDQCPHAGGPLCSGVVSGLVDSSTPGEYTYHRRGEILRCPWHGWEFDITTGQSWYDPERTRVRSYETRVETGAALSAAGAAEPGGTGYVEGPYVAETYPVEVDQEYVILHV